MILSSADIYRLIGGDPVIRLLANIQIVDGKPPLTGEEGLFIYIDRFPEVDEFEATWKIWVIDYSDEPVDVVINTLEESLPQVKVSKFAFGYQLTTTEFKSANTQVKPSEEIKPVIAPDFSEWEDRFQTLVEDVQDQMLLVTSGRPGKDGKDGVDGKDGADGKDLLATDANLNDLNDVDLEARLALQKGHVLTWDGTVWTNLFIPQVFAAGTTGDGAGDTGAPSTTIQWKYHNEVGEPHDREFHTNNSNPVLVTSLHVSFENNSGTDVTSLLNGLLPNTDKIYLYKVNEPSSAHLYSVSGYATTANGIEITVAHLETPGGEPLLVNNSIYGFTFITAGTGGGGGGITDAPSDNTPYVRYNGTWITWAEARDITAQLADIVDGGDFDQDLSFTGTTTTFDGGDFVAGTSAASDQEVLEGGEFTPEDDLVLDGGLATV